MSYNINLKSKKQDNSHFSFMIIIGFFILALSINFVKLIREYTVKKQILKENRLEQDRLITEQNKLKLAIKKNQTKEFIEEQARKLTLSKPNEVVVILASPQPTKQKPAVFIPKAANYKLWLELFFP